MFILHLWIQRLTQQSPQLLVLPLQLLRFTQKLADVFQRRARECKRKEKIGPVQHLCALSGPWSCGLTDAALVLSPPSPKLSSSRRGTP